MEEEEQSEQLEQPEHALADPVTAAPAEPVAAPRVMLSALPDAELFAILRLMCIIPPPARRF